MFLQETEMEYLEILKNHKLNLEFMPIETYYKERNAELYVGSFLTKECESDAKLSEMATKAFISSMRAYGTHSDETKAIFNVRNLHLGHFAGSFGLTEPPSHIVNHVKNKQKKVDREMREKRQVRRTRQASRNVEKKADSEFSSGF